MKTANTKRAEQLKTLGINISRLREEKKVSQKEMSVLLGYTNHAHLSRIEGGKKAPSVVTLLEIADALDIPVEDFFTGV